MIDVSQTFLDRWRSRKHAGAAKPNCEVTVRRVTIDHRYDDWDGEQFGEISGKPGAKPWQGFLRALEAWRPLPNILNARIEQSFDGNGIAVATLTLDNIYYKPETGPLGVYHVIEKGWFSPLRSFVVPGRPPSEQTETDWFEVFYQACQVTVYMNYGVDGAADSKPFTGLVDSVDLESKPGQIVISLRDFGQILVDEHFFGWAKDRNIKDPIIFVPRNVAENITAEAGGARASSADAGFPAKNILDRDGRTYWRSDPRENPNNVEWTEVSLPAGRYRSIYLHPKYDNQTIYIGFYLRPRGKNQRRYCTFTPSGIAGEQDITPDQMVVHGYIDSGLNDPAQVPYGWWQPDVSKQVPESSGEFADGGWPYVKRLYQMRARGRYISLGGELECGENTLLRIGVASLGRVDEGGQSKYYGGIRRLAGMRRTLTAEARKERWVVVDDVSDIVKVVLRWSGFKDWDIESAGANIKERYVCDKSKSFMDVINEVKELLGYVFFIGEPVQDDDLSMGIPTFRQNRIFGDPGAEYTELRDQDLLTGFRPRYTKDPLRTVIRVRGKPLPREDGGRTLGDDETFRAMFVYWPPWRNRLSGVIKHLTHYDPKFETHADCEFAAYLIALQIGLASFTGQCSLPGTPHIGLDQLVAIRDRPTGTTQRLYVSNRLLDFQAGENAHWTSELGGGVPDTPDCLQVALDYLAASAELDKAAP